MYDIGRRGLRRGRTIRTDQVELRALPDGLPVVIRPAYPDDAVALARLADLDDGQLPQGRVVVAEVAGELWAAASLDGSGAVADPFRPSGALLRALRARARPDTSEGRRRGGRTGAASAQVPVR